MRGRLEGMREGDRWRGTDEKDDRCKIRLVLTVEVDRCVKKFDR